MLKDECGIGDYFFSIPHSSFSISFLPLRRVVDPRLVHVVEGEGVFVFRVGDAD